MDTETTLDEVIDTELEEDTADVENDATDGGDTDDEFEYDEDGNIIIPDVVFDEEEDGEVAVEEEGETDEAEESEDSKPEEEVSKPDNTQTDEKDQKIARLEAELAKLTAQGRDTLEKMGVKKENVLEGLAALAAEADGKTTEQYLKEKATLERAALAEQLLRQQAFEKVAQADLAELHAAYPETKQYTDIRKLPEDVLKKFGRFRDAGLSAKEAYAAANPDGIRNTVATAVKKQSLHESKNHLRTNVPKGSKDNSITMTKAELASWRDLFPGKTDREIMSLYKQTSN